MNKFALKHARQRRRKKHVRKQIYGRPDRPRLTITRTLNHIYAQIIDDEEGRTLVSASTLDKNLREQLKQDLNKVNQSKMVGEAIAKRALDADIKSVSFDRNGFLYHGRVKALADGARKGGLQL